MFFPPRALPGPNTEPPPPAGFRTHNQRPEPELRLRRRRGPLHPIGGAVPRPPALVPLGDAHPIRDPRVIVTQVRGVSQQCVGGTVKCMGAIATGTVT